MTYLSFPSPPTTLLTAEEAERSIDYIQAELSRVQRACEYRQQHPYDPATAVPGSTGRGVGGRGGGSVPSRPFPGSSTEEMATSEPATRSAKRHADGRSSPASPSPSVSPSSTARAVLSFSEFERRRIAQLLGRVAVELAAVWAYVHQWSSMEERELPAAAAANANAAAEKEGLLDPAVSLAVQRGQSSGQGPTHNEPHLTRVKKSSPRDGASSSPLSLAQQQEQQGQLGGHDAAGLQDEREWGGVAASGPAAQLAALNTLIQTATSIQNLLLGSGPDAAYRGHSGSSSDGGGTPRSAAAAATASNAMTELSPLGDAYQRGRQQPQLSVSESVLMEGSVPRNDASVATLPPSLPDREDAASVADTAVRQTWSREVLSQKSLGRRPAAHAEQPLPSLVVATGSQQRAGRSGSGRKGKATIAIPDYLRAYVVETSDSVAQQDDDEGEAESNVWEGAEQRESVTTTLAAAEATVNEDEYNGEVGDSDEDNEDDDATMIVNADRGDSRSVSAGSATGIGARPFSRTSDSIGVSHADSSYTSPSSAAPAAAAAAEAFTSPSRPSPAAMTAAHSIMAHHRFDSDMGIKAPSSPFKRLVSGSSLRSSSLIGSPVQQTHQGQPPTRQLSHSTGSAPSHAFSSGHNRSATERSPDSAEMSPAAVAAYSRSTSLLRRPHRLEVPVSRTSSLRRHPTSASPRSATSGSPPGTTLTTATITNSLPSGRPHASSSGGGAGAAPATTAAAHGPVYTTAKGQGGSQHPQPQHQRNSSGSGIVHHFAHGGPVLAGSPPVFLSSSAAGDSPSSSSMAGLPFKRVTSVDSEYGGWPPGSLTDSFDMSQWKGSSVSGHPGSGTATATTTAAAAAPNANVLLPVPAAQDAAAAGYPLSGVSGRAFASSPLRTAPLTAGGGGVSGGAAFVKSGSASFGRPTAPSSVASSSHSNSGYMLPARISTPNTNALKRDAAPPPPPLPPHSYRINAQKLTAFLQCVRDLTQTEFSEDEFDSMHLFYFLPGVSLATPQSRAAAEATDCPSSGAASADCGGRGEEGEAPPLPLFEGGDNVPVRLSKLDVFHSFVVRKVEEVCANVGIPSAPFLSIL